MRIFFYLWTWSWGSRLSFEVQSSFPAHATELNLILTQLKEQYSNVMSFFSKHRHQIGNRNDDYSFFLFSERQNNVSSLHNKASVVRTSWRFCGVWHKNVSCSTSQIRPKTCIDPFECWTKWTHSWFQDSHAKFQRWSCEKFWNWMLTNSNQTKICLSCWTIWNSIWFCFFQITHDFYVRHTFKELVEFVWARCAMCKELVGEVRVLRAEPPHHLKRVLCVNDLTNEQQSRGLCCIQFKEHLQQHWNRIVSKYERMSDNRILLFHVWRDVHMIPK